MIFGRAGEEIAMLEQHGISVSVVPGISAALALASGLGISLTHRDCAQAVRFVTGHSKGVLPDNLDWRSLADPATTNIYYMSRRTLPDIVQRLLDGGMAPTTPAVIASDISLPNQKTWRGTIADSTTAATDFDLSSPTLFAVGTALGLKAASEVYYEQPAALAASR
jgi:uroporphyrin-III C-methyltransferase/precorrin-2 dehydrogenase/sirohydrochlorin ferrochelatase